MKLKLIIIISVVLVSFYIMTLATGDKRVAITNRPIQDNLIIDKVDIEEKAEAGPKKDDIVEIDFPTDDYLYLVNRSNTLSESYLPDDLVNAAKKLPSTKSEVLLRKDVVTNLTRMFSDIKKAGINSLKVVSGYRSYNYQVSLHKNKIAQYMDKGYTKTQATSLAKSIVAIAGQSEHQTGLAVDVSVDGKLNQNFSKTEAGKWLNDNAYKYGFVLRYPSDKVGITGITFEPWHFRYVGKYHSYFMKKNMFTLEEYIVYLKKNVYNVFNDSNGNKITIQYVKDMSDIAEIDNIISISNINSDGVVVVSGVIKPKPEIASKPVVDSKPSIKDEAPVIQDNIKNDSALVEQGVTNDEADTTIVEDEKPIVEIQEPAPPVKDTPILVAPELILVDKSWAGAYIYDLIDEDIISVVSGRVIDPNKVLSRMDTIKLIAAADFPIIRAYIYDDNLPTDTDGLNEIRYLYEIGAFDYVVNEVLVMPKSITRGEFVGMISGIIRDVKSVPFIFKDIDSIGANIIESVGRLVNLGIIQDGSSESFRAGDFITLAEASQILSGVLDLY